MPGVGTKEITTMTYSELEKKYTAKTGKPTRMKMHGSDTMIYTPDYVAAVEAKCEAEMRKASRQIAILTSTLDAIKREIEK